MRFFILLISLVFGNAWAAENIHYYPNTEAPAINKKEVKDLKYPGYCEIEIVNDSHYTVRVNGVFTDGYELEPFRIYPHEYPHYISLYYYGWCHYGMDIYIETLAGYRVYSGYTRRYDTIHITSDMYASNPSMSIKSDIKSKSSAN